MHYQSKTRLCGLPLVHVSLGGTAGPYPRRIASGWIAIGDIAFGILFAAGGISAGAVSVGGLAAGLLAVGGLTAGFAAAGGLAVGVLAAGGAAFGWLAAMGGLAVASTYAAGGAAFASHANDSAARQFFAAHPFFLAALRLSRYSILLVFLPVITAIAARRRVRSRSG